MISEPPAEPNPSSKCFPVFRFRILLPPPPGLPPPPVPLVGLGGGFGKGEIALDENAGAGWDLRSNEFCLDTAISESSLGALVLGAVALDIELRLICPSEECRESRLSPTSSSSARSIVLGRRLVPIVPSASVSRRVSTSFSCTIIPGVSPNFFFFKNKPFRRRTTSSSEEPSSSPRPTIMSRPPSLRLASVRVCHPSLLELGRGGGGEGSLSFRKNRDLVGEVVDPLATEEVFRFPPNRLVRLPRTEKDDERPLCFDDAEP